MVTTVREKAIDVLFICETMDRHGYRIREDGRLNIVGIRSADLEAESFNDWICVFYTQAKPARWVYFACPATTDPGEYYRLNPINVNGTAILKPGQYIDGYRLGTHTGYEALVQNKPVTVFRDDDKNGLLNVVGAKEETGFFGIHIHHSGANLSGAVGKWSAGCQVFDDILHFSMFIAMCRRQGGVFDYTLLTDGQFKK